MDRNAIHPNLPVIPRWPQIPLLKPQPRFLMQKNTSSFQPVFVATPDAKNRWKRWNSSVKPEVDGEESHD
jgi:hypothetical protein